VFSRHVEQAMARLQHSKPGTAQSAPAAE
jgi:hypothetical protein